MNQYRLAKVKVKTGEYQLQEAQLEVATQVKQVYWQLTYLNAKKKLLQYQDSLYSGFSRAADLRAKSGETNKLEMMTARSQSLQIKNQLHQLLIDINVAKRKLQTILCTKQNLEIEDAGLIRLSLEQDADFSSLTQNPSLNLLKQNVTEADFQKSLEKSKLLPDFSIGYFNQSMQGVQDVNGQQKTFGTSDRFWGIQAGIAVPLWFGPSLARVKAAKLNEDMVRNQTSYFEQNLQEAYRSLVESYEKFSSSVDFYEQQAVPEANLIIEQSTKNYKAGGLDYTDYVFALARALEIKQNYLEELNNLNQTIINIESIKGKIY
jgi:cobalt-zinc-cadmium resistance protein CzcA